MTRNATITFGPFSMPVTWLVIIGALAAGYITFSLIAKKKRESRKVVSALLVNALLIFLVAWKISPLFFHARTVIQSPLTLFYMPGGVWGSIIGGAAAVVYFVFSVRRKEVPFKDFGVPLFSGIGAALLVGIVVFVSLPNTPDRFDSGSGTDDTVSGIVRSAPVFTLPDLAGEERSLEDYRGRVVFLNFWATWCPPCRAEIPEMVSFYAGGVDASYEIVSVNLINTEESLDGVKSFVKKNGIDYPVLLDHNGEAAGLYGVQSIPTTVVIGTEGELITQKAGTITRTWMKRFLE